MASDFLQFGTIAFRPSSLVAVNFLRSDNGEIQSAVCYLSLLDERGAATQIELPCAAAKLLFDSIADVRHSKIEMRQLTSWALNMSRVQLVVRIERTAKVILAIERERTLTITIDNESDALKLIPHQ
jgi:hypothetical protein